MPTPSLVFANGDAARFVGHEQTNALLSNRGNAELDQVSDISDWSTLGTVLFLAIRPRLS
jgi:hypothetical protein